MADQARASRRRRTRFTEYQLCELTAYFTITHCPKWKELQELASRLQLDSSVVRAWFKNQVVKLKKQQQAGSSPMSSPAASPGQATTEAWVPGATALSPQLPSESGDHQGPQRPQESAVPAVPGLPVSPPSQSLEALEVPWTDPLPCSTEELVHIYTTSEEEDFSSLEKYLFGESESLDLHIPDTKSDSSTPEPCVCTTLHAYVTPSIPARAK
ncbi:paired-like homeodomain transcription factor LEUTX [Dipodomys spectabilis]|uniref:paired-like homeodomain transcription factor LEUTX n=1 Tax=Dipodomys spectabilis TaxID=105255 RepID=UPI001C5414AD|nr:paired-like homeodomain transcription factor LEUTX [Dipodomys spectabilis]